MKAHVKIYFDYFDFALDDFIPCEVCKNKAVDIHHIDSRGMGGDPLKKKDVIENLQALCRKDHDEFGDDPKYFDKLTETHLLYMKNFKS